MTQLFCTYVYQRQEKGWPPSISLFSSSCKINILRTSFTYCESSYLLPSIPAEQPIIIVTTQKKWSKHKRSIRDTVQRKAGGQNVTRQKILFSLRIKVKKVFIFCIRTPCTPAGYISDGMSTPESSVNPDNLLISTQPPIPEDVLQGPPRRGLRRRRRQRHRLP